MFLFDLKPSNIVVRKRLPRCDDEEEDEEEEDEGEEDDGEDEEDEGEEDEGEEDEGEEDEGEEEEDEDEDVGCVLDVRLIDFGKDFCEWSKGESMDTPVLTRLKRRVESLDMDADTLRQFTFHFCSS